MSFPCRLAQCCKHSGKDWAPLAERQILAARTASGSRGRVTLAEGSCERALLAGEPAVIEHTETVSALSYLTRATQL